MIEALGTQAHNGGTVAATWLHSLGLGKGQQCLRLAKARTVTNKQAAAEQRQHQHEGEERRQEGLRPFIG